MMVAAGHLVFGDVHGHLPGFKVQVLDDYREESGIALNEGYLADIVHHPPNKRVLFRLQRESTLLVRSLSQASPP